MRRAGRLLIPSVRSRGLRCQVQSHQSALVSGLALLAAPNCSFWEGELDRRPQLGAVRELDLDHHDRLW